MQPRAVDATGSGQPNGRMQVGESNENVVDTLRRRYVQAELQLRECEDRFRRDCARQEQELELIQMENNKLKQKIEEIRMAESSVDRSVPTQLCASVGDIGDGDSKLLKASSQKYRWAREAVDKARGDLVEYESRLAAARERCKELRNKHGSMSIAANASSEHAYRIRRSEELQVEATRAQLRGLELHVTAETKRLSNLLELGKAMRREIDLQITLENQMEELRQDREGEIVEIMKETSFLIEVCNLLVEERSEYEYQLAELRKAAEEDAEAYERAFHELVAVEERNKAHRQELNESIDKLTEELALTVKDRQKAEREVAAMQNKVDGAEESEMVKENSGLRQQLKEFETYFELFSKIVGSSDVNEIERYVCGEGGERFQLYEMIQNKQNAMRELAKEKAELIEKLDTLIKGTKNERHDREELRQMQDELARVQKETESIEQQAQKTSAMLSSAAVCLEKIFSSIGCTAPKLVLPSAGITPSQHVVHELFAAIERRVEEYIITWMEKDPKRTKNPSPPLPLNSTTGCSASVSKTAMSFGNVGCAEETLMTPMLAAETGETAPFVDVDENNDGEGVFSKEEH